MKSFLQKILGKPAQHSGEGPSQVLHKSSDDSHRKPAPTYEPGDLIRQDYEVHKVLGKGGCGIVYLVYSRKTKSVYALKTFLDEFQVDSNVRNRFRQEAAVWINLERHPFLVRAHFVEEIEGRLFVGMDYIAPNQDGINSLEGYLSRGSISLEQCLRWAIQFCYGMEHAYSKGIRCHRDIKPANILVDQNSVVKISDFGLAGVVNSPKVALTDARAQEVTGVASGQTIQGQSFGTPTHMPPEQFIDAAKCDERSDIYSFGVVLHQLQSKGTLPFLAPIPRDNSFEEQTRFFREMFQIHAKSPPPICASPMSTVIQQCLAKDPRNRYQRFAELRADIEKLLVDRAGQRVAPPDIEQLDAWEWNNKGGCYVALDNFEQALDCFDKALSIAPWFVEVWGNKAVALKSLGRLNEAMGCINKALELDPSYAPAKTSKGSILNKLGRFSQAIDCFDDVLRSNDRSYEALASKGVAFMGLARFDDALLYFDKSLALYPKAGKVLHDKAICLQALGKSGAALDCCDRAIAIDPRRSEYLQTKALCLSTSGDYEAAFATIEHALSIDPSNPMTLFAKAGVEEQLGRKPDAVKSFKRFLTLAGQDDREQVAFAKARIRDLEKTDEELDSIKAAKARLAKAESIFAGKMPHISALNNLAEAYKAVRQYERAESIYKETLSLIESKYPGVRPVMLLAPTLNNLANLYHGLGRFSDAAQYYERAIELVENDESYGPDDPNLGAFLTSFAALKSDLGMHSDAQALCERALRIKEKAFGSDAVQLISTLQHYVVSLEKNGITANALKVKEKIARIRKKPR